MDTRDSPYIDNLAKALGEENIISPEDIARMIPLYIKVFNDKGVVRNVSLAYIKSYDGKSIYRKHSAQFNQLYEMFLKNAIQQSDRHLIFKRLASRFNYMPKTVSGMKNLFRAVVDETHKFLKNRKLMESRKALIGRFSNAVKKYLHLTYSLGFNEPSVCAKYLAENHKIDKYIMSGDFPVILLPFLPEVESAIKKSYEHYEMKDAWEVITGRYFNHKGEYSTLAVEIKSSFNKTIPNFSEYFDRIYTDTYYKKMLESQRKTNT